MDLRDLLVKWEAPEASSALDERVYAAFKRSARSRSNFWIPFAAAAAGGVVVAGLWMRRPVEIEMDSAVVSSPAGVTAETELNVTGFVPITNGKIVVVRKAEN
jgi:hypothetical protein